MRPPIRCSSAAVGSSSHSSRLPLRFLASSSLSARILPACPDPRSARDGPSTFPCGLGSCEATADPAGHPVSLELGHGRQNPDHGIPECTERVDPLLLKTPVLHAVARKAGSGSEASSARPLWKGGRGTKRAARRISASGHPQRLLQLWPVRFAPGNLIEVFRHDRPAHAFGVRVKFSGLVGQFLPTVVRAGSCVDGNFHKTSVSETGVYDTVFLP